SFTNAGGKTSKHPVNTNRLSKILTPVGEAVSGACRSKNSSANRHNDSATAASESNASPVSEANTDRSPVHIGYTPRAAINVPHTELLLTTTTTPSASNTFHVI